MEGRGGEGREGEGRRGEGRGGEGRGGEGKGGGMIRQVCEKIKPAKLEWEQRKCGGWT